MPDSNFSILEEIKIQRFHSNLTPNIKLIRRNNNSERLNEDNTNEFKDIFNSNINSEPLNISVPKLILNKINKNSNDKQTKSNILIKNKSNEILDKTYFSDDNHFDFLTNINNINNKNDIKYNIIHKNNSDKKINYKINSIINSEIIDELTANINNKMNNIYLNLNSKIKKLSRQYKNLADIIFPFVYEKKLINKRKKFPEINYLNINFPQNNILTNQKIDLSYKAKSKSNKEQNSNNNDINNISKNEDKKINAKELLKKLDSFLIKKFKEN